MVNIFMSNLPADREVASHDCPTCAKRRIRCDRTLPKCLKCSSRDLDCPGFKAVYLKWDQGVASRGKFAGRQAPVIQKNKVVKRTSQDAQKGKGRESTSKEKELENLERAVVRTLQHERAQEQEHEHDELVVRQAHAAAVAPISRLGDAASSTMVFDSLINHFCTVVVSRLTWVDVPTHPLRTTVQRLLGKSPCLRLSIGSLAAAHLSITCTEKTDMSNHFFDMHVFLRDASLRQLNNKMRYQLTADNNGGGTADTTPVTEVLASMLFLCYAETFVPGSRNWKLHLHACRTITDLHELQGGGHDEPHDSVYSYVRKEVSDLQILSSFSAFNEEAMSTTPLGAQYDGSLWAFTGLVHDITTTERQHRRLRQASGQAVDTRMGVWQSRAEQAYNKTLAGAGSVASGQEGVKECFQGVIRAHYYATLIYSYQAFSPAEEIGHALESFLDPLMNDIRSVLAGPSDSLLHDVFFPMFIAGTACGKDTTTQKYIERVFRESVAKTGIYANETALQFLQVFWAQLAGEEAEEHWIEFAHANPTLFDTFIVF